MCSENASNRKKIMKIMYPPFVDFWKILFDKPFLQTLQALRDKLKDGTFEEPLTDEELIRISASGSYEKNRCRFCF